MTPVIKGHTPCDSHYKMCRIRKSIETDGGGGVVECPVMRVCCSEVQATPAEVCFVHLIRR